METTVGLADAASLLHISTDAMRDLAASGVVPGAKIGKEWVFLASEIIEYLRGEIKKQTSMRRGEKPGRIPSAISRTVRNKPAEPPSLN